MTSRECTYRQGRRYYSSICGTKQMGSLIRGYVQYPAAVADRKLADSPRFLLHFGGPAHNEVDGDSNSTEPIGRQAATTSILTLSYDILRKDTITMSFFCMVHPPAF